MPRASRAERHAFVDRIESAHFTQSAKNWQEEECASMRLGPILIPPPKARERTAAVCGAPAAAARRGQAFSDNSATLGIRACCGWSFGHSRDPVVVPRCVPSNLRLANLIQFQAVVC